MDWILYLFFAVHGRITRTQFWIGLAVLIGVELAAKSVIDQFQAVKLGSVVGLALDYPEFALAVKRANDRDLSAWAVAAFFLVDGLSGFLDILGFDQTAPSLIALVYVWLAVLVVLIADLGFRRGTVGPNRYGPDPLAGSV